MSLLWRRATIAGLVLLGLTAVLAALFGAATSLPLTLTLSGYGGFLGLAALAWYDGRRLLHALLFSSFAAWLAAALFTTLPLLPGAGVIALATLTIGSSWIAWFTRERAAPPSLTDYYDAAVRARRIRTNPAQVSLVAELDALSLEFLRFERRRRLPWAGLLQQPNGVYLHGPAGRGKSFLLDGMYDTNPSRAKIRLHFHDLSAALTKALHEANTASERGFARAATKLAPRGTLVFVDEVNVLDLATARLFMRLLTAWWRTGCVIAISSNQSPQQLFKGLPLPAEELAKFFERFEARMTVRALDGGEDYRLQKLTGADLYQHPITPATNNRMREIVELLAEGPIEVGALEIGGRKLIAKQFSVGVAWFSFAALCESPCSYQDYLQLVARYPNLLVSDVPHITNEDSGRRLAWLVEIFYDRRKRLILSAHVPVPDLFAEHLSSLGTDVDFHKIMSRLTEMQSSEYDYTLV